MGVNSLFPSFLSVAHFFHPLILMRLWLLQKLKEVGDVKMLENLQKTLQNFKINSLLVQEGGG